ncbi:MAG: hypothetical protein KKB31_07865 [Nanoarchaeota archaeon]|nr:hypothetical protein [Nanoarchaeota archaeon]
MRPFIAQDSGVTYFGVIVDGELCPMFIVSDVVEFREVIVDCCNKYLEVAGATVPEVFEDAFKGHLTIKDLMK